MLEQNSKSPRSFRELYRDPKIRAWVLCDWANSAFATTVMAGFFPVFFKTYWSQGIDATTSTFWLGVTNSVGSFLFGIAAPSLGAIADQSNSHMRFLIRFTLLGALSTLLLAFVGISAWPIAAVLYGLGSLGFSGNNAFYDALLPRVADEADFNHVSSLGYALGYLGGGLLFLINVIMTLKPHWFGIPSAAVAVQISFFSVGVWWFAFTIPAMRTLRDPPPPPLTQSLTARAYDGISKVIHTVRGLRRHQNLFLFLLAYFLYIDGVGTIMKMAVDYGLALGFPSESLIVALLVTQFVGFPAAIGFSLLTERIGVRTGLYIAIGVYTLVTGFAYFLTSVSEFYVMAIVIGAVQGGIQAISRSAFATMVPEHENGELFGFYNLLGKFATVLGPLLVGVTAAVTESSRASILSILGLFLAGALVLSQVSFAPKGREVQS